jgi:hypothetical protein
MKTLLVSLLLMCGLAFGSDVVLYDPTGLVVTNRVIAVLRSVNTTDYESLTNVLINPVLPTNPQPWKVLDGNVVALTAQDQTAISNAFAAAQSALATARQTASKTNAPVALENFDETGRLIRALAEVTMNEINILRTNRSTNVLSPRTLTQLKTAITNSLIAQP